MKKRGTTFIEIIVAITIFLIAILPISKLTLNSLSALKRTSEIEEGARITTTVINYIKSQGYNSFTSTGGSLEFNGNISYTYILRLSDDKSCYTLDLTSNGGRDFEEDFMGGPKRSGNVVDPEDSILIVSSLGISSDTININVNLITSNLELVNEGQEGSYSLDTSYINPINNQFSDVIIGSGGVLETPIIYGNVETLYTSKNKPNNLEVDKHNKTHNQNFIITPIENY